MEPGDINGARIIAAVMRGAVQHKLHERIQHSPPTLAIVQRSSFGYVLDEEYDPARHTIHLNHSFEDAFTGRRMARRQIRWLVRKVCARGQALVD